MTKKRMFEGTNLDNKIPKKADFQSMYDENFSELCTFYGLDAKKLLNDKTSPWRELSHKLMEHLTRGSSLINQVDRKNEPSMRITSFTCM